LQQAWWRASVGTASKRCRLAASALHTFAASWLDQALAGHRLRRHGRPAGRVAADPPATAYPAGRAGYKRQIVKSLSQASDAENLSLSQNISTLPKNWENAAERRAIQA
jgi:hypothetical protein